MDVSLWLFFGDQKKNVAILNANIGEGMLIRDGAYTGINTVGGCATQKQLFF